VGLYRCIHGSGSGAPPVQRTVRDEFEAAARIDRLQWILAITGFQPPDGFSYTAHSVRVAAASGAAAIDVTLSKIRHEGG
jgi:hypothetical protein